MNKQRALSVEIFKSKFGDCSNGGISSRYNGILVLHPRGNVEVDMDNPPENLCEIVRRELFGRECDFVRPVSGSYGTGFMAGGCIVDTSDSRWSDLTNHPLKLHDRCETWEQYDMLSR